MVRLNNTCGQYESVHDVIDMIKVPVDDTIGPVDSKILGCDGQGKRGGWLQPAWRCWEQFSQLWIHL